METVTIGVNPVYLADEDDIQGMQRTGTLDFTEEVFLPETEYKGEGVYRVYYYHNEEKFFAVWDRAHWFNLLDIEGASSVTIWNGERMVTFNLQIDGRFHRDDIERIGLWPTRMVMVMNDMRGFGYEVKINKALCG